MKAKNRMIDMDYLDERVRGLEQGGWSVSRWIMFCQVLIAEGYHLKLREANETVSKYITVWHPNSPALPVKVRFSNHMPNRGHELRGDCDYFVGRTHTGARTTEMALDWVRQSFKERKDHMEITEVTHKGLFDCARQMAITHYKGGGNSIRFFAPTLGGYTVSTWVTERDGGMRLLENLGRVAKLPDGAQVI